MRQPAFLGPRQASRPAGRQASVVRAETVAAASLDGAESKKFMGIESLTWSKILPLGFIFFCILFNYTILRDTKVRPRLPRAPQGLTRCAVPLGLVSLCAVCAGMLTTHQQRC